jgi:lipopolysaccharide export system permease protein
VRAPILKRYIASEILPGFLVNMLVFTSIMLMAKVMDMANLVISKGVGLSVVIEILLLATPKVLSMTLPMGTLLAVLTAFLRLSADSELTVLRASGVSLYQMSPPVLIFGATVGLLTAVFSLWLAPEANWRFKAQLLDLAKARADLAIEEQTFVRSFQGLVMYVSQLTPGADQMRQVFIHDGRSEGEAAVIVAQRGQLGLDRDKGALLFHLEDGVIDRVYHDSPNTDSIFFQTYELKISPGEEFEGGDDQGLSRGRSEFTTGELLLQADRSTTESGHRVTYRLEWHRRWALPFTSFVMALIGLPLGASFRVRGRNFALLMGLGVFIVYYVLFSLGWSLAESGLAPPGPAIWASNVILAILGGYMLRRINRGVPVDPLEYLRRLVTGTGKPRSTSRVKTS